MYIFSENLQESKLKSHDTLAYVFCCMRMTDFLDSTLIRILLYHLATSMAAHPSGIYFFKQRYF